MAEKDQSVRVPGIYVVGSYISREKSTKADSKMSRISVLMVEKVMFITDWDGNFDSYSVPKLMDIVSLRCSIDYKGNLVLLPNK